MLNLLIAIIGDTYEIIKAAEMEVNYIFSIFFFSKTKLKKKKVKKFFKFLKHIFNF